MANVIPDSDTCVYCNDSLLGGGDLDELDRNDRNQHREKLMGFPICHECHDIYREASHDNDKDVILLFNTVRDTLSQGPLRTQMIRLQQALASDLAERKRVEEERAWKVATAARFNNQVERLRQLRHEDEVEAERELALFYSTHPDYVDFFTEKEEEKPTCETCVHHGMEDVFEDEDETCDEEEVCYADEEDYLGEAHKCPRYERQGD